MPDGGAGLGVPGDDVLGTGWVVGRAGACANTATGDPATMQLYKNNNRHPILINRPYDEFRSYTAPCHVAQR